jgi:tRNA(Ile)-lysidine synthase
MLATIVSTIKRCTMLSAGDHVIVGVSGGADSVALLHVLHGLQRQWGLTLTVAHLNHMLRGEEARREAQFVAELAHSLGVACVAEERDVRRYKQETGCTLQEAAREVRYEFFLELLKRCTAQKVALGHHADDQAETLMLWLIRGTSLKGLAGMQPVREHTFIRPLINVTRSEIEAYLTERQIQFIPDMSTREQHYLRNKIRHHLLPIIRKDYNPSIVATLSRLSELIRRDREGLEQLVTQIAEELFTVNDLQETVCRISELKRYPEALRGSIIKHGLACFLGKPQGIYFRHIQGVNDLVDGSGPAKRIQLPGGCTVIRQYDELIFTRDTPPLVSYCYTFDSIPERIRIHEIERDIVFTVESVSGASREIRNVEKDVAFLAYDEIRFPLLVRNFCPGDHFYPLGLGGRKKIKDFLIEKKIPSRDRYKIPVLLFQDRIAWVGGLRIDDRFRLKPGTNKALKVVIT